MFPFLQVRFISVNDNFDSLKASIDESSLIVPLKNLMNEVYARDCSKKIQSSFRVKQQRGEFCGAFAPYGYIKVGTALVVDGETAPIVKMIYAWRLEGVGVHKISLRLNEMKILPPSKYRFVKGITKAKKHEETLYWYQSAVKRILQNPAYTGILAQARYKSNFLKGGGVVEVKQDDWIVVEHTHPSIIDKDVYEAVQKTFKGIGNTLPNHTTQKLIPNRKINIKENIFNGLIFCGDCGKHMCRSSRRAKFTYVCFIYSHADKQACTMKPIKEAELRSAVFAAIKSQIKLSVDMERIISELRKDACYQKQRNTFEIEKNNLQSKLDGIQKIRSALHEDCVVGILSEEDYISMCKDFETERNKLQQELNALVSQNQHQDNVFSSHNKWITEFKLFEKEEQLSTRMLMTLVERIDVYDNKRLNILFRYRDEFEELIKHVNEYKARDVDE